MPTATTTTVYPCRGCRAWAGGGLAPPTAWPHMERVLWVLREQGQRFGDARGRILTRHTLS